ncbi:type III-B CRISPR-associated protein Cas10/Cmr2 [Lutibacter maritimus]|uniref:CRISPR-associated protein, Cmr2 family n=1 Tax=Lutibacter maritimus TaxID=593133 RepID=A0A1I6SQQ6_9FLAO|nr:type III-B CRISPR-associated protein Cas10/Cmr2 [Lutibacter maritimus]SFS79325.1 CRISPR-associated protein, Cmr2 family [Lutibacter maritimus]
MKKYLLLFTIGPVKSFINDARKTHDLFAGSALLSKLTYIAIDQAKKEFEKDSFILITPVLIKGNTSIPNRFLASFTCDEKSVLKSKIDLIKKEVSDYFISILNKTKLPKEKELPKGALKQLQDALDIKWVIIKETDNFKNDFIKINQELASLKNYNAFGISTEIGRKCIVDGSRNVKFYRRSKDEQKITDKELLNKKLYQEEGDVLILENETDIPIWQLQEGEGLSAVSLAKRLYQNEPHLFPSTVAVCLMDLFEKLKENGVFNIYKNIVQKRTKEIFLEHSDDQLFYKENIHSILKKLRLSSKEKELIDKHKAWSEDLELPLTKYYALVRFDGDNLGDWFSGVHFKVDIDFKDAQIALSKQLGVFAQEIKDKIKEPIGKIVYAGGEDFMAFINIHHLFEALKIINTTFLETINNETLNRFKKEEAKLITISLGVAIAHYKQPLAMVLDKASEMEKKAKDNNRNSFAIGVLKHSGNVIDCTFNWQYNKEEVLPILIEIHKHVTTKKFSTAFIRKIYHAFEEYGFNLSEELTLSKIKLYVPGACNVKDKELKANYIKHMIKNLKKLLKASKNNQIFGDFLLILDFLTRKTDGKDN